MSILDVPSVMYIWDQCFLQSWQSSVIEHFCIALLELLRHRFMEARDYLGMKEVKYLEVNLTLCILMDFLMQINIIMMGVSIISLKWSQVEVFK